MVLRRIYILVLTGVLNTCFSQIIYQSKDLKGWDSLIPRYTKLSKMPEHSIKRNSSTNGRIYTFFTPNNILDTNQFVLLQKNLSGSNLHQFDSVEIKFNFLTESDWSHHPYYPNLSVYTYTDKDKWRKVGGMYSYKKMNFIDTIKIVTPPFIQLRFVFKTWATTETTLGISDVQITGLGSVFTTVFEIYNNEKINLYSKEGKLFVERKSKDPIKIKLYDVTWRLIKGEFNDEANELKLPEGIYFYIIEKEDLSFQRGKISVQD